MNCKAEYFRIYFSCGNGNTNDECDFVHDLGCGMVRCITDHLLRTSLLISLVFPKTLASPILTPQYLWNFSFMFKNLERLLKLLMQDTKATDFPTKVQDFQSCKEACSVIMISNTYYELINHIINQAQNIILLAPAGARIVMMVYTKYIHYTLVQWTNGPLVLHFSSLKIKIE